VSAYLLTVKTSTQGASNASEHGKMQTEPSRAIEPLVWTKPKGMLDKKGEK
jgi:hypothetical protein